jgi:glycosyltransferase involved in cell wall biosynthesis
MGIPYSSIIMKPATILTGALEPAPTHVPVQASAAASPMISVLVPIYNEAGNIPVLCERLLQALEQCGRSFEIILVNDGSRDNSLAELKAAAINHKEIKVIGLRRNYGQTAALMAGIDHAHGEILVPIDADLQNDPADIPLLIRKLEEGYDCVSGWRKDRKDAKVRRIFVSRMANRIISWVSGVELHDYGCTLKAYRKDVIKGARLYGEMHRFIPIYASWLGANVTEIPVSHAPRLHGKSKYGLERILKVVLDIIVVKFLDRHFNKPIHVFGGFGLLFLAISALSGLAAIYLRLFESISFISTPLPLMTVMAFITGCMSILMGLLAEMIVRTYYESQNKTVYIVSEKINLD